jgi:hypothetical protein
MCSNNSSVILIKQIRGVNTGVILIKQIRGEHRGDSDKANQRSNHPCVHSSDLFYQFFFDLFYQNHPCVHSSDLFYQIHPCVHFSDLFYLKQIREEHRADSDETNQRSEYSGDSDKANQRRTQG